MLVLLWIFCCGQRDTLFFLQFRGGVYLMWRNESHLKQNQSEEVVSCPTAQRLQRSSAVAYPCWVSSSASGQVTSVAHCLGEGSNHEGTPRLREGVSSVDSTSNKQITFGALGTQMQALYFPSVHIPNQQACSLCQSSPKDFIHSGIILAAKTEGSASEQPGHEGAGLRSGGPSCTPAS